MEDNVVNRLVPRLRKIGINVELFGNYPWIYLDKVNCNKVKREDFFEGRNPNHVLVFDNLVYEQMRWDEKNIYYYVNNEGELVLRINTKYTYDENASADHLPFGTNPTGYSG